MADRIRIGAVAYLNTRPLVFGMEQGLGADRIELSYDVPAVLAERMRSGAIDVALLPVIEFASRPDLEIVPGLGIVTQGDSRSVLLISRVPASNVENVALDPESRTSNALTRVLFSERWDRSPAFGVGEKSLERTLDHFDAAVRIGDKALFETPPEGAIVYDLGAEWTQMTGLPFVFAAWIARPGAIDREIYQVLHESRRRGGRVIPQIAADYGWEGHRDPALAERYLTENIHYRLGAAEVEGLSRFLNLAAEHGIIDAAPALRFALRRTTDCDRAAIAGSAISRL